MSSSHATRGAWARICVDVPIWVEIQPRVTLPPQVPCAQSVRTRNVAADETCNTVGAGDGLDQGRPEDWVRSDGVRQEVEVVAVVLNRDRGAASVAAGEGR